MSTKIDTKQLDAFAEKLKKASNTLQKEVTENALNSLTSNVLGRTIKQTPRDTSNLARSWKASNSVTQRGNTFSKTISNSADYAVYVEYGHRTRNHRGWVPGKFMLTRAVDDVEKEKERIVSGIVNKHIGDLFK